jgi:hypothetical protein
MTRRLREVSDSNFYLSWAYHTEITAHCLLGHFGAAESLLSTGRADDRVDSGNLIAAAAYLEAHQGHIEETKKLLDQALHREWQDALFVTRLVEAAFRVGKPEIASALLKRALTTRAYLPMALRLEHGCHPLLDQDEFSPRKAPMTLIWPLEAPMIDRKRFALFEDVRIKSGRPDGTSLLETV